VNRGDGRFLFRPGVQPGGGAAESRSPTSTATANLTS
jgi:hypothetical protein